MMGKVGSSNAPLWQEDQTAVEERSETQGTEVRPHTPGRRELNCMS